LLPATLIELETTMPHIEIHRRLAGPPPMLTIMLPDGVPMGISAPNAARPGFGD
jgi:hypothetical protein